MTCVALGVAWFLVLRPAPGVPPVIPACYAAELDCAVAADGARAAFAAAGRKGATVECEERRVK